MLNAFKSYIKSENLFTPKNKILLAVSGGLDSVVMLDLFSKAGCKFGIAHVNFNLRGEESDGDEKIVKALAKKYEAEFHLRPVDTKSYSKKHKISTQMAAREIRYEFFEQLKNQFGYDYIATAHHKDDQIETLFINLLRGTGISGLRGILPKQNDIIRPLLFASRKDILEYQMEHQLAYREDSSNASDAYLRNKIRHNLLPSLKNIDENYLELINENMKRFGESEQIYKQHISDLRKELVVEKADMFYISIDKLKQMSPLVTFLYEILKPYGFLFSQSEDIVKALDGESGRVFQSDEYELLKDRSSLVIRPKSTKEELNILINEEDGALIEHLRIKYRSFNRDDSFQISRNAEKANFDFEKLQFPLQIRKWKQGDVFKPLGSKFKKKLSDFFIDRKFNLFEKENTFLLCSGDDIVWIMSHQMDDRFKITENTKRIFEIEIQI